MLAFFEKKGSKAFSEQLQNRALEVKKSITWLWQNQSKALKHL
jgi:hypothetical protein